MLYFTVLYDTYKYGNKAEKKVITRSMYCFKSLCVALVKMQTEGIHRLSKLHGQRLHGRGHFRTM